MIYAECGGFMFLCEAIEQPDGARTPMSGLFPGRAVVGRSLAAIGYVELDVDLDGASLRARGHEFRYSRLEGWPAGTKVDGEPIRDAFSLVAGHGARGVGYAWRRVLASYVHLHFGSAPRLPQALVERAVAFRAERG
jgi:cobyrinic acid a,c-diamide synthase